VYQRRGTHDPQMSPWLAHRNHMHPAVHRAQDAITREPQRDWSLADLAEVACVSPRHLTRLFAQHTGISVVVYQQQLRIARAKDLLSRQRLPVERVAGLCGFASARDLRRVWRKYEAGSPVSVRGSA
jgi:transcriptional regulator GlxA family with amidase domain